MTEEFNLKHKSFWKLSVFLVLVSSHYLVAIVTINDHVHLKSTWNDYSFNRIKKFYKIIWVIWLVLIGQQVCFHLRNKTCSSCFHQENRGKSLGEFESRSVKIWDDAVECFCLHLYGIIIDSTNMLVANLKPLYWALWPRW